MDAVPHATPADGGWLETIGSPRVALALMVAFAGVGAAILGLGVSPGRPVAVVSAAMAVNLGAAMATRPAFRRYTALTAFHACLLAIAGLAAVGRSSRLVGHVEVTEGEGFRRELGVWEAGPLHYDTLDDVDFRNEGFTIPYAPGLKRGPTRNRVSWDRDGERLDAEIGDQTPLTIDGYHFYTTANKGFAPVVEWVPDGGGPTGVGVVHLPSYPMNALDQRGAVAVEGLGEVRAELVMEEPLLSPDLPGEFRVPEAHAVRVEAAGVTASLRPGESAALPGGKLVYVGLRSWMGYYVHADWTLPWLLAAGIAAVVSLLAHYARAEDRVGP
ncbi:MAG: hypothetical protein ACOZNI_23555 [Myxococcota bacterium]